MLSVFFFSCRGKKWLNLLSSIHLNFLYTTLVSILVINRSPKTQFLYLILQMFRAMDFLVALFRNLLEHPDWPMSQACTDSYGKTLKKWHGWLASSAFTVTSLIHSIIFFFGSLQVEPCDAKPRPYPCIIWPIFIELYFLGFITVMPFGAF